MLAVKRLWVVLMASVTALSGGVYAGPGGPGRGPGGGPGGGPGHGPAVQIVIAPPRVRPVVICPPRHFYVEPVVIVAPPPVVVAPARTVVVAAPVVEEKVVVWVTNANGSRTPVTLVRLNDPVGYYMGPKGEYYACLPTDEQLRPMYGLVVVSAPTAPATLTVWITNDNGSKTPLTLTASNGGYVGPSGEFYATLPSEQQLKAFYGLPSQSIKAETKVVQINIAGKQVPIVLVREGDEYVGPKGEHYTSIPTKEQLEAVYGQVVVAPASNNVTIWVESGEVNIPITLQKQGDVYVGPNGEQYKSLPTADQLKAIYAPAADNAEVGVMITKADGTQTVVTLKRKGTGYVGPNGESYTTMPTEEQLKAVYGK